MPVGSDGIPQVGAGGINQNTWLVVGFGLILIVFGTFVYAVVSSADIDTKITLPKKTYSTGVTSLMVSRESSRYDPKVSENSISNGKLNDLIQLGCRQNDRAPITVECLQMVVNSMERKQGRYTPSRPEQSNNNSEFDANETVDKKWARRKTAPSQYQRITSQPQRKTQLNDNNIDFGSIGSDLLGSDLSAQSVVDAMMGSDGKNQNEAFADKLDNKLVRMVEAMPTGNLDYTIRQGKIINATIENSIVSQLPGMIRGITSHDIYGESGEIILIPRGSRLIGFYNSSIQNGQNRLFTVWTRLIRPDGIDILIDSSGQDGLGRSGGLADVDTHFWKRFGMASLLSVIGAGVATINVGPTDGLNSSGAYRQGIANAFQQSAGKSLNKNISIPNTLSTDQGSVIHIMVKHDLNFFMALRSLRE